MHGTHHDGDALGVDGAEVRVLKETHQVRLGRLLLIYGKGRGQTSSIGASRVVTRRAPNRHIQTYARTSCSARMAVLWKRRSVLKSCAISLSWCGGVWGKCQPGQSYI